MLLKYFKEGRSAMDELDHEVKRIYRMVAWMLKDLRNLSEKEQQEYLDRFIMANEEQKFPQEVVALYLDCSP